MVCSHCRIYVKELTLRSKVVVLGMCVFGAICVVGIPTMNVLQLLDKIGVGWHRELWKDCSSQETLHTEICQLEYQQLNCLILDGIQSSLEDDNWGRKRSVEASRSWPHMGRDPDCLCVTFIICFCQTAVFAEFSSPGWSSNGVFNFCRIPISVWKPG